YTQYGYVPHLESIGWQMRANVLLLPLRKEKESAAILTGKFYEYIACRGEIFAFGPVNGDLGRILKETGRGMMAEFDDGVAIEAIMRGFAKDYCSAVSKPATVEKFSRVKTTEQLAKLLDEISRK
ncbi:MAG: glycosyl transferase family 1, partial [Bacteroidales bacterium]|nr:glycosyl transferase family 1 [Bacteroidales bacterium]